MTSPDNGRLDKGLPRARGGQPDNENSLRHGLRSSSLPKSCRHIRHRTDRLRRELENTIVKLRGSVSLRDASLVQSACRWEAHSLLAAKFLREEFATLSAADKMAFSREVATATESRDRCIDKLKLDALPRPPWLQPEGGEAC